MSIYLNKKESEIQLFLHFYHGNLLVKPIKPELMLNIYDKILQLFPLVPLMDACAGKTPGTNVPGVDVYLFSREDRYLRTISATLKTMAWSNWRRSRPVSFLIFSRR